MFSTDLVQCGHGQYFKRSDGYCLTARQVCDMNEYGWCNLLGTDALEEHYQPRPGDNDDGSCRSQDDCPNYTQTQLQIIMNMENQTDMNQCQFYNVSCHEYECRLGRTWNTYQCVECSSVVDLVSPLSCPQSCSFLRQVKICKLFFCL